MKDVNKNKKIVANMNHNRLLTKEKNSEVKPEFNYSDKKSYVDYTKRKKKQDYFSAHINNVDFVKKLPF